MHLRRNRILYPEFQNSLVNTQTFYEKTIKETLKMRHVNLALFFTSGHYVSDF